MAVTNNTMILRRELMTRMIKHLREGTLRENIDRIPYIMRPRDGEVSRCCVYKDRAMLKYRAMGILGFGVDDEVDEMTSLAEYTDRAMAREKIAKEPLSVMTEACSACVKANYVVTNMCRGCVGRPCMINCNKDAIKFENGQAHIMSDKCVNCGLCMKNCPFHAIVYMPVPCEEACPVGAISKDEKGKEHIDPNKCIYCGRCISACPFGAVIERSQLIDIFKSFNSPQKTIAIVAPAIAGQFKAPLSKILNAIKMLGFDEVVEVAKGANETTERETAEFVEKMEAGEPFMTTSCCPSYYMLAARHIPEIKPYVSHTSSPMVYTAELVRKENPDAKIVFVAPCLAKRFEGYHIPDVDLTMSFEEVGTMFIAMGINPAEIEGSELDETIYPSSRIYAITGGVMDAVKKHAGEKGNLIKPIVVNGINKQSIRELKGYVKSCPGNMVEVMACEGGCINGCNTIANPKVASRQVTEPAK